jgi:mxaK protein
MTSRRATRSVLLLLALMLAAAAIDGVRAWQQHRLNGLLEAGPLPPEGGNLPAQLRFAQAYEHAASGADEVALNRYRSLHGDSPLGQAARYNSANVLMRQALVMRAGAQPANAIVLIELAKETYREVLRTDPGHWDARYNLERAQRLLADPDDEEEEPAGPQRNAERAATTMRGYSPGLP